METLKTFSEYQFHHWKFSQQRHSILSYYSKRVTRWGRGRCLSLTFLKLGRNCPIFAIYGLNFSLNPIQDGLFWGLLRDWQKASSLPKICHAYPTMMKLGAIIPYLKKIQKTYKSHDTPLGFSWHQRFFTGNQQFFLYQEIQVSIIF